MADMLENPFAKKAPAEKPRNYRFRTRYYDLLAVEDRASIQQDLNGIVNDFNKFDILEFTINSKADGSPYALARYGEDVELERRNLNWFDIHVQLFAHYQLEDMDEILNQHNNRTVRVLGEKRFVYKTGEVVIFIIWAEIRSSARSQEPLDVIRTIFSRS